MDFLSESDDIREIPVIDATGKPLRLTPTGSIREKGAGRVIPFKRGKVVWGVQSDNPEKVILIEEIIWPDRPKEIRLGYRTTTRRTRRWWWGESALIAPPADLQELIAFAVKRGLLSNSRPRGKA